MYGRSRGGGRRHLHSGHGRLGVLGPSRSYGPPRRPYRRSSLEDLDYDSELDFSVTLDSDPEDDSFYGGSLGSGGISEWSDDDDDDLRRRIPPGRLNPRPRRRADELQARRDRYRYGHGPGRPSDRPSNARRGYDPESPHRMEHRGHPGQQRPGPREHDLHNHPMQAEADRLGLDLRPTGDPGVDRRALEILDWGLHENGGSLEHLGGRGRSGGHGGGHGGGHRHGHRHGHGHDHGPEHGHSHRHGGGGRRH
ncbi:MAG: hypothetical protein Q9213_002227 [Squamulea squamosa]